MAHIVKQIFRTISVGLLAFMPLGGGTAIAGGIVTITFDDGGMTQYRNGLRIAKAYGLPGTIFVPTAFISEASTDAGKEWVMNWDEIREFRDAGWEIGAHGVSHLRLTDLTPTEVDREVEEPIGVIQEETGIEPVSFSSPYGAFDDETIWRIMESYYYHLSWKGHGGRNPIAAIDRRYIGRFEVTNDMNSARVCGEMVRAAQNDIWLVLLFHGIVDADPQDYEVAAWQFEEVVACASLLAEKQVIQVLTIKDAMEAIGLANELQ